MAGGQTEIHMSEVAKSLCITVRVRGVRVFHWRLRVFLTLLKWITHIAPVNVFIEIEGPGELETEGSE